MKKIGQSENRLHKWKVDNGWRRHTFRGEERYFGHLLLEWKSSVRIGVKEIDQAVGLILSDSEVALIAEVGDKLARADEVAGITVKSLEGRVRCEVSDGTKTDAGGLEASLTVSDGNKQVFESALGFETKAHDLSIG